MSSNNNNIINNNNSSSSSVPSSSDPSTAANNTTIATANSTAKRKRRPAGTPDPDAEVVSLSPRTLLESDRYVCEICNQGFQRDQNLQMHRRRHKVPWKLLKRSDHDPAASSNAVVRKRVFVCPEPTCLHHDPRHALGDLVGIKKHFRRKHSNHKQWACGKCSKAYAVHSDFKAHLKTCGTRGHSCDCGRVFSRVESFIEHQDTCHMGRLRPPEHHIIPQPPRHQQQLPSVVCLSRTGPSPSPPSDTNINQTANLQWGTVPTAMPNTTYTNNHNANISNPQHRHNLDLQLSIGSSDLSDKNESSVDEGKGTGVVIEEGGCSEGARTEEMLKLAMAEMAYAEEARREAKRQIEIAESEFASAKKIRQQAVAELEKAKAMKEQAVKKISSTLMQITCHACKVKFQMNTDAVVSIGHDN